MTDQPIKPLSETRSEEASSGVPESVPLSVSHPTLYAEYSESRNSQGSVFFYDSAIQSCTVDKAENERVLKELDEMTFRQSNCTKDMSKMATFAANERAKGEQDTLLRVRKAMLAFGEKHFSAEDGEHSSTPAHRSDWLWLLKEVGLDKPDAIRNSICDVWKTKSLDELRSDLSCDIRDWSKSKSWRAEVGELLNIINSAAMLRKRVMDANLEDKPTEVEQ